MKLVYYKQGGKYYSTAECPDPKEFYEARQIVLDMNEKGKLPGLHSGTWDGFVVAISQDSRYSDSPDDGLSRLIPLCKPGYVALRDET